MPELPEVETLARGLRKHVQGQRIAALQVLDRKRFRGSPSQIKRFVTGATVSKIERRAKWLILWLSSGYGFVIHLKLTGQLLFDDGSPYFLGGHTMHGKKPVYPNAHTRVIFVFKSGSRLFFQDQRRFGYVELYATSEIEHYFADRRLAREPLERGFTFAYFQKQMQRRSKTSIKAALLDQTVVGGIGNIYADDTLWLAKIKPMRRVGSLNIAEQRAVFAAAKKIIKQAVALGGTSFSHYFKIDGKLGSYWQVRKAYDCTGQACRRRDGGSIKKIRVAGRGTHYCPVCQK